MIAQNKNGNAFYEAGSWYHRVKVFNTETGETKYTKKGGFSTPEEAEKSFRLFDEKYKKEFRLYHAVKKNDMNLDDYLIYWLDAIYSPRIENSTRALATYVLYDLLLPHIQEKPVKLKYVTSEYLDAVLAKAAKTTESAGNKCREILNIALKDAMLQGLIKDNPTPATKPYKRKKPKILILNKEQVKRFLRIAAENPWYLEILLALFMGLRKGEIAGLMKSDYDAVNHTLSIKRQITANPIVKRGEQKVTEYNIIEKEPKTVNSYRTLLVPARIVPELNKRLDAIEDCIKEKGDTYINRGYISCTKEGLPHATASFNTALSKLCSRNGLPHLTVHSLRHMYATILLEQGVPLVKVSALLGHSSIHTTFEYYCEVTVEELEKITGFMNNTFTIGED